MTDPRVTVTPISQTPLHPISGRSRPRWTTYMVFDLETGGLDPATCGITEIAAVAAVHDGTWQNNQITSRFVRILKPTPGLIYTDKALEMQCRTLADLEERGVTEAQALADLSDWVKLKLGRAQTVSPWAHNAAFDMSFISAAVARNDMEMPFNRAYICSMILHRILRHLGIHNGYRSRLEDVCNDLGIAPPTDDRHHATGDAEATCHCIARMMWLASGDGARCDYQQLSALARETRRLQKQPALVRNTLALSNAETCLDYALSGSAQTALEL